MLTTLNTEVILSLAIIGTSALAICGTIVALTATQRKQSRIDLGSVVKNAPYHRLLGVVSISST